MGCWGLGYRGSGLGFQGFRVQGFRVRGLGFQQESSPGSESGSL